MVTPEWAAEKLARCNGHNRPLSSSWVRIKAAILGGNWHENGETVVFDTGGVLRNGQHRLQAIVEAGVPVPCLVVYGVSPDAFATYDQGKKRGAADVLSLLDFQNASCMAAALTWVRRWEVGQLDSTRAWTVPNEQVAEYAARYPELVQSVYWARSRERAAKRLVPPGQLAFTHWLFTRHDPAAAAEFFRQAIDGIGVAENTWEFVIRTRLEAEAGGDRNATQQIEILALMIKAFNFAREGRPVPQYTRDGKTYRRPSLRWRSRDNGEGEKGAEKFPELE